MRTLFEQQAIDAADVFLVPGENAERVTFYPAAGGTPREIVVAIDPKRRSQDGAVFDRLEQTCPVFCLKDESHAKGGIESPTHEQNIADSFVRAGDPDTQRFVFTGGILEETDHSWVLEFSRPRPVRVGGGARG